MDEKTTVFFSFIDGELGIFKKPIKNPHSKKIIPVYRPPFDFKYGGKCTKLRHGALEVDPKINVVQLSGRPRIYPGQAQNYYFIIPTRDMKDVVYEDTLWYQLMTDSDDLLNKTLKDNDKWKAMCSNLEKKNRELIEQLNSSTHSHQRQSGIVCPNCNNRFSIDEIRSTGGLCPECKVPIIGFQRS